jgi:hypothetical protein
MNKEELVRQSHEWKISNLIFRSLANLTEKRTRQKRNRMYLARSMGEQCE